MFDVITVAGARNPPDSDLVDRVACRVVFRPDPGGAGCLDQRPVMILMVWVPYKVLPSSLEKISAL